MMNRRRFISTVLEAGALTQLSSCASRKVRSPIKYVLADEFDGPAGSAPDRSNWEYDVGGGGWGNGELQVYTSSRANSFQDGNGNLVIRATKHVETSAGRTAITYYSARLKTVGKFSADHGNFEARIKLDIQRGLWPAWWALGANFAQVGWPACGEVDMLENYGDPLVQASVHTPNDAGTDVLTKFADISADDNWHIWRMSWRPDAGSFAFYKDGVEYMTVERGQIPNWCFRSGVPIFMILNVAVGGKVGPPPSSVHFPVDLLVDYVRVW
jgi:beta-glucanase (GH16 family)